MKSRLSQNHNIFQKSQLLFDSGYSGIVSRIQLFEGFFELFKLIVVTCVVGNVNPLQTGPQFIDFIVDDLTDITFHIQKSTVEMRFIDHVSIIDR